MIGSIHGHELEKLQTIVLSGSSVLILGESGSGKTTVIQRLIEVIGEEFRHVAIASYTGSTKPLVKSILEQLHCPTTIPKFNVQGEAVGEKEMSVDEMKTEAIANCGGCLICADNADRWSASLRYWLGLLLDAGATLICTAITDPQREVFLKLLKVELSAPSLDQIRDLMYREAIALNLDLSPGTFARLQQLSGTNLMLAKKVVKEESLGLTSSTGGEHRNYIDIAPFVNALLTALGIIRFVGLGIGDRTLYIFGGIVMLVGISFKYLSRGLSRKKPRLGK